MSFPFKGDNTNCFILYFLRFDYETKDRTESLC